MTNIIFSSYCAACTICCGPHPTGLNAAGRHPIEGHSIAAPRSIPLGTVVRVTIPSLGWAHQFVVDDRTARRYDGRWDIYISEHRRAKMFGLRSGTVTIIK